MGIELWDLKPPDGAVKKKRRVGRGPGSGRGKTAGKGTKGQKSRSGGAKGPGFEGGQMPIIRRLPKKGFSNPFKKVYDVVNVSQLNRFNDGDVITPEVLKKSKLASGRYPVKILGNGELERSLEVHAHKFSKSAEKKITGKGGKVKVL